MTVHFAPPARRSVVSDDLLLDAARCWRAARDAGQPVQPRLFRVLDGRGAGLLAPVLDSLMALCEAAVGRKFLTGRGGWISSDEFLLLGLVEGATPGLRLAGGEGLTAALDCALRSTRIVFALEAQAPCRRRWRIDSAGAVAQE